ncbi:MAG: hypothetical protein LUG93_05900 [Lachnospiraceae bacterium]|nr:hypothetical protein [Lachnospiraceae bacterium]
MNMKEGKKKLIENLAVIVVAQVILKAYGYLKNGVFGWEQIKDAVFFIVVYMVAYVLISHFKGEWL